MRSRPSLGRHALHDRLKDQASNGKRLLNLLVCRLLRLSGVAELPGVTSQRSGSPQERLECCVDIDAELADLPEIVGSAKRLKVPRQKSLERLLNGLLAMEKDITDQRRRSLKIVRGGSKILSAVPQPLPRPVRA